MEHILSILFLINTARTSPLVVDKDLSLRAQNRAEYLCTRPFSHDGWTDWFKGRYGHLGENLAKDFPNATSTHEALMNSPSHKANIVSPDYTKVGVGFACNITIELFN